MHYVGVDIGRDQHSWIVMDESRKPLASGILPHDSQAYGAWLDYVERLGSEGRIVAAIETRNGPATPLDQLIEASGWKLVTITPEAVRTYRERVLRKCNKTDATDAEALAILAIQAAEAAPELKRPRRSLHRATRALEGLTRDVSRVKNRLRRLVGSYWLEAAGEGSPFYRLDLDYVVLLLERYPDPAQIARMGVKRLLTFLRRKGSRVSEQTVAGIVAAAQRSTLTAEEKPVLLRLVQLHARQLRYALELAEEARKLVEELAEHDVEVKRLATVPGVSQVQTARFMAEVQDLDNFAREGTLASYAGFALAKVQTGRTVNTRRPQMRANRHLKQVVFQMADTARLNNPVSRDYYQRKVAEGKTHRQALRCLGRHLLRMFWTMLRSGQDYRPRPTPAS